MIVATVKSRDAGVGAKSDRMRRLCATGEREMRRLWMSVSLLALVLVATSGVASATHSPSAAREVVGLDTTGAQYALFLPYNWNGDLVVYAHGFFDPATPVALPDAAPVDVAPWVVELRERLLQAGYAVAYSSFSENGWAVDNGAQRTRELRPLFTHYFYKPDRTFVIGRSLGSLITMLLVEKYAVETTTSLSLFGLLTLSTSERVLDGALALCGPVGGGRKQTDYVGNTRVLFDFFYPGVIPGDVLHVPAEDYSSTSPQVQAMTFLPLAWVWSAGAFRPSRRQGATDGLHAALDPVSEPEEGARRLGRAEVAVAVPVVGLLHELSRGPRAVDDVCQPLLMGERHVRVERRVEGQDGSL